LLETEYGDLGSIAALGFPDTDAALLIEKQLDDSESKSLRSFSPYSTPELSSDIYEPRMVEDL
jgi:hypothetical protein